MGPASVSTSSGECAVRKLKPAVTGCIVVVLAAMSLSAALGQEAGVLELRGRGVGEKSPYSGGGTVRFVSASTGAELVHYDGSRRLNLPLTIEYEVLERAPVALTSRLGTEYWRVYSFAANTITALHTDERIDLSRTGRHAVRASQGRVAERYGESPSAGLAGVRGHYYFLIEPSGGGEWLDVTSPPGFFDQPEICRRLTFTLADLSEYTVEVDSFQSTWRKDGRLRVRVTVTDAKGRTFPVVNAPLTASAGNRQMELETQWGLLGEPTGWMVAELPGDDIPREITVSGTVTAATPHGTEERRVRATFERGRGRVSARELKAARQGYELPRNDQGVVRETRALWIPPDGFDSAEETDRLVARCKQARLNVLVPDIFVRSSFSARSDLLPPSMEPAKEFDPLRYLITEAHSAGLEVHPWFCVTYRDGRFRRWFEEEHGVNTDLVDREGDVERDGADVHRPEYRDFIVDLMVGVARDYQVDGIHLDYIRSMGRCYCERCRREFAGKFAGPLAGATEEEWINWQRDAVGDIVRRTARGVRAARKEAVMSAAVFSNMHGGAVQGQDPAGWAEKGWLDVVIPMDYATQTLAVRAHESQFLEALDDDTKLITGLSLYRRSGGSVRPRDADLVRRQIELVRGLGIHGYCLFCSRYLSDAHVSMLRRTLNAGEAVPYFRE